MSLGNRGGSHYILVEGNIDKPQYQTNSQQSTCACLEDRCLSWPKSRKAREGHSHGFQGVKSQARRKIEKNRKKKTTHTHIHTQADRVDSSRFAFFCYNRQLQTAISTDEVKWHNRHYNDTFKQAFGESAVCIHKLLAIRWKNITFVETNGHHLIYGTYCLKNITPLFLVAQQTHHKL